MQYKYAVFIGNEGVAGYFRDNDKFPNRIVVKIDPKDANRLKHIIGMNLIKDIPRSQPPQLKEALEKKRAKENVNHIPSSKI